MRTIKDLSELDGRVFVLLDSEQTGKKFLQDAESEGFTFADGIAPTMRHWSQIMAVNRDGTLNYVGTNGRIAFGCKAEKIGDKKLIRVDYRRYASGAEDYIIS